MWRWALALLTAGCATTAQSSTTRPTPTSDGAQTAIADDLVRAELALERMDPSGALAAAQAGVARAEQKNDPALARLLAALGDASWNLGRRDGAELTWRRAVEIASRSSPPDGRALARALLGLSEAAHARGNLSEAVQLGQQSLAACEHDPTTPPLLRFRNLKHLGLVMLSAGHVREAIAVLERARGLLRPGDYWTDLRLVSFEMTLAEAYRHARDLAAAVPHFEVAVALATRNRDRDPLVELDVRERLAQTLDVLGRKADAVLVLEAALDLTERRPELADRRLAVACSLGVLLIEDKQHPRFQALQLRYPATFRTGSPADGRVVVDAEPHAAPPPLQLKNLESDDAGNLPDAARTVASLRGDFRACYAEELGRNKTAHGAIRLRIEVGPEGEVTWVRSISLGPLGDATECVMRGAGRARFSRPAGGAARIIVPITFIPTR